MLRDIELFQDRLGRRHILVGADGQAVFGGQLADDRPGAATELGQAVPLFLIDLLKAAHDGFQIIGLDAGVAQATLDQGMDAVADEALHRGQIKGRPIALRQQQTGRLMQIGDAVDQRAVQIEQNCFRRHAHFPQ
jgi:hypothetical protein